MNMQNKGDQWSGRIVDQTLTRFRMLPIDMVLVGERTRSDPIRNINLLISSIQTNGLLHPILVRKQSSIGKDSYILLAGERRLEAYKRMGKAAIPAHIIQMPGDEERQNKDGLGA
jgi:ParB family chromosome partitioning protein